MEKSTKKCEEQKLCEENQVKEMPLADCSDLFSTTPTEQIPKAVSLNESIPLSETTHTRLITRRKLLCQEKILKFRIQLIENHIKEEMKDSETGTSGAFYVSWKFIYQHRFDVRRFKEDFPEMYYKYLNLIHYRKFKIKNS